MKRMSCRIACCIWSVLGKEWTGLAMYLLSEVKSMTKRSFFDFLGTNPAGAYTLEVSLGPSRLIIPCLSRSSRSCWACSLICSGIVLGLNLYNDGSSLLYGDCFNFIFIGGHFKYRNGFNVLLKSPLCSLMNFCS